MKQTIMNLRMRWHKPVAALPIDMFRVLVGLLSTVYFIHLAAQTSDISGPDGLIDHRLVRDICWCVSFRIDIT